MAVSQSLTLTETSYSTSDNTSSVRIVWKSTQTGESWNGYGVSGDYYVSINGSTETKYHVDSVELPLNSTVTIVDTTITVPHRDDGTGSVKVRTWMNTNISAGVVEKSASLNLTTIARASDIDSVANQYLGSACSVQWTPKSSSFRYKLKFSMGNWSHTTGVIYPNRPIQYTYNEYTIPLEAAWQIPNSKTGTMTVTLYTYKDSNATNLVGSTSKTFTVTVPNNESTQPTVSMSLSPSSTLASPYNNLYIQGHSKVKATLDPETKYGATVTASSITVDGTVYESPYESGILSQAGTVSVKATVKDSRGYYGTNYKDIEVIPYSKPYIRAKSGESSVIASRCDASANLTDSGTYLKIKAKIVYSKVISNGVQNNYGKIKFRYRKENGSYSAWETILDCKANNSDEVITPPLLNGALDTAFNYQVQIIASDDFGDSVAVTIAVPSEAVYMDRPSGGKSMGLGGYSSGDGNLDIYWKTKARGGFSLFDTIGNEIPLGTTMPIPRDQISETWSPDNVDCGVYVVAKNIGIQSNGNTIMSNGILIQFNGTVGGNVKVQLALPVDANRNPMYRICWYNNWSDWRSMKL